MWKWKETKVKRLLQKRDFVVKWVNFSIWLVHFENFISIASSNIIFNGKSRTSSQSPPHLSADMPNVEPAQVHAPLPISILLLIAMTDERKGHKFFCFHSLVENWRMARRKKSYSCTNKEHGHLFVWIPSIKWRKMDIPYFRDLASHGLVFFITPYNHEHTKFNPKTNNIFDLP